MNLFINFNYFTLFSILPTHIYGEYGAKMLTETLAMYTEMMLYKKIHSHEKMRERLEFISKFIIMRKACMTSCELISCAVNSAKSMNKNSFFECLYSKFIDRKFMENRKKEHPKKWMSFLCHSFVSTILPQESMAEP